MLKKSGIVAVLVLLLLTSCYSGSGNFPEENTTQPYDDDDSSSDDDDDSVTDDDDSVDDDDTGDDDDAVDDDDSVVDDDDAAPPDCAGIANKIYDFCSLTFVDSQSNRPDKDTAIDYCEEGGGNWACIDECYNTQIDCNDLADCINDDCSSAFHVIEPPAE